MSALFLTQGKTLEIFLDVAEELIERGKLENPVFFVSDELYFKQLEARRGVDRFNDFTFLKEWDLYSAGLSKQPDLDFLRDLERRVGDPVLWDAIVSDRRLSLGRKSSFAQDYRSQYSHEQILSVLEQTARSLVDIFDQVKPKYVAGFICVTVADYLSFLIARERGIPFINLRPTRISNYFVAGETVTEPSISIALAYEKFYEILKNAEQIDAEMYAMASGLIQSTRQGLSLYEGVIPARALREVKKSSFRFGRRVIGVGQSVANAIAVDFKKTFLGRSVDNYYRPGLYWIFLNKYLRPKRLKLLKAISSDWGELRDQSFAFFPLHKEPEVTLLVYGRHCLNQIEVIRNVARSLPVGMKLVVKEHPVAVGYRTKGYYDAILSIPNVVMVDPSIGSEQIIPQAEFVVVISGSIGFEAVVNKKPVITLGDAPFNVLPTTMVLNVTDFSRLSLHVMNLKQNAAHDETALVAYILAVLSEGVPVNFYSGLLEREGAHSLIESGNLKQIRAQEISRLASYIDSRSRNGAV